MENLLGGGKMKTGKFKNAANNARRFSESLNTFGFNAKQAEQALRNIVRIAAVKQCFIKKENYQEQLFNDCDFY